MARKSIAIISKAQPLEASVDKLIEIVKVINRREAENLLTSESYGLIAGFSIWSRPTEWSITRDDDR